MTRFLTQPSAGGVVDCTKNFISRDWQPDRGERVAINQVLYGNDLLAADSAACEVGQEAIRACIAALEQQREASA